MRLQALPYIVELPSNIQTAIHLPASKSISNRALIINALAGNRETPRNLSDCDDTNVMLQAFEQMNTPHSTINIGAAGTAMRFTTALLSATNGHHFITGSDRMKQRPIGVLVEALRSLGAHIKYVHNEGYPPLDIEGCTLQGGTISISGNVSSQYISALLMIAPTLQNGLLLELKGNIISRPYIDLTLTMMRQFGAQAEWISDHSIRVEEGPYRKMAYEVENDWSAASYWFETVALSADRNTSITLTHLQQQSAQGDSVVRRIFGSLGVESTFNGTSLTLVKGGEPVRHFEYDFTDCPDLVQTVVVTCCLLGITFRFTGLQSLKIKETDRIEALKNELRKWGYVLADSNDSILAWDGTRCEEAANTAIDTYDDHRMAMAFAPAAAIRGRVVINHPEVVSKSYPHFWEEVFMVSTQG